MTPAMELIAVLHQYLANHCERDALYEAEERCYEHEVANGASPIFGPVLQERSKLLVAMRNARVGLGKPEPGSIAKDLELRVLLPGERDEATGELIRKLVDAVYPRAAA